MILRPPQLIETPDVTLRRMTAADTADIHAAVVESGETLWRYESWAQEGFSATEALQYIAWWERAWEESSAYYYGVVADGIVVGSCGLGQVDHEARTAAIGYWVRTGWSGRGVATAAVEALAQAAFAGGFAGLSIVAAASNAASRRVAEKVGGVERAGYDDTVFESGDQVPAIEYTLVP